MGAMSGSPPALSDPLRFSIRNTPKIGWKEMD